MRELILADVRNAEHLVERYLGTASRRPVHLPKSLTPDDTRGLLDAYLDYPDANPNVVRLISIGRVNKTSGVDAKLKLKATRKHDAFSEEFFKTNASLKTGCEVSIVNGQDQEVVSSLDGLVGKYSYSQDWLTSNLDFSTILNNFIYLFEFVSSCVLLRLPSYPAQLGVFERFMGLTGKAEYKIGAAYRHTDQASYLQTRMYDHFLRTQDIELEQVIQWFFVTYLNDEFGAANFRFQPSSPTATYLERSRHMFSEMESVVKQFSLYAENGELDRDLLSMSSEQLIYEKIPSQLRGKYSYATDQQDISRVLYLLFSDQSGMGHLNETLSATNFVELIMNSSVTYEDFLDYQTHDIDFLIHQGIVENTGTRISFTRATQFYVLKGLWDFEATSYYHHPDDGRAAIDEMEAKGWIERRSSLLTHAEASYFNYYLNQSEYSNGPDLRNRYLHGSQADGDDDQTHFETYIFALRLLIALVIKINDDFDLSADRGDESA